LNPVVKAMLGHRLRSLAGPHLCQRIEMPLGQPPPEPQPPPIIPPDDPLIRIWRRHMGPVRRRMLCRQA
jgi:hypothetical protein